MSKLTDFLKEEKRVKKNNVSTDLLEYERVKNSVEDLCSQYLKKEGYVLKFEVPQTYLNHVINLMDDPDICSRFQIVQVSESLFTVTEVISEIEI